MSLFSTIFEGVINEVKAEDAYNRFYSQMPKEDFEKITGGEPEIDKFVQFLLNTVRDGISSVDEAAQANKEFKTADPLVRQNILNAFRSGEYESAQEVLVNLQYLKEGGFINKKKFAKEGYVKVAENDEWLVTCTTNYMANNHYFGHTKWCTASDRMGRFDGYLMYKRYGQDGYSLLMQFTKKGTNNETYQAEVDGVSQGSIKVSTICNIEDEQISLNDLKRIVGPIVDEVLNDIDKLKIVLKIQMEQKEHEDKYQEKQTKIIREKRRREEERLRRIFEEVSAVVEERNAPIREEGERKWQEMFSSKAYENVEFLNKLLKSYDEADGNENYEEIAKQADGFVIYDKCNFLFDGNSYLITSFELGYAFNEWYVKDIYDPQNDVTTGYEPAHDDEHYDIIRRLFIIVRLQNNNAVGVIAALKHDDGFAYVPSTIGSKIPMYDQRFMVNYFHFTKDDHDVTASYLFDLKSKNMICYDDGQLNWPDDYAPKYIFPTQEGNLIFISYSRVDAKYPIGVIMLNSDGSYKFLVDSKRFLVDDDRTLLLDKESGELVRIDTNAARSVMIPDTKNVIEVYRANDSKKNFLYISNNDMQENIFDMETSEYVFGQWCDSCGQDWGVDEFYATFETRNGDKCKVKYNKDNNTYTLVRLNGKRCEIPCDKYGVTEEDKKKKELSDRNLKAWQDAGGYSPETKAQMDAMWADREAKDSDGSAAMKAWNDENIPVRHDDSMFSYAPFFKGIDKHEDDPNWGRDRWGDRLVGLRDPEEFFRTYETDDWENPAAYRPGQTYRIDRQGRPLDQPWRDEDEVPARFTDDSLNESVKKVITLMNKLIKD